MVHVHDVGDRTENMRLPRVEIMQEHKTVCHLAVLRNDDRRRQVAIQFVVAWTGTSTLADADVDNASACT